LGQIRRKGRGYAARKYREAAIVETVQALPADAVVFTNDPFFVSFYAHRPSVKIPSKLDRATREIDDSYLAEMEEINGALQKTGGYLIVNRLKSKKWYYTTEEDLHELLDLTTVEEHPDGVVFQAKRP
jgi:hypothetical protein